MTPLLASIPPPPFRNLEIGPLNLRMYGLMIALGVLAAVWIAQKRWQARGHDPADIASLAMWAVPAGIVGARAYHVATDWQLFEGREWHAFAVWEGGLGIPGGIAAGVLAGYIYARVKKLNLPDLFDTVAPALPVAQAIGRWGNYFNQELFGRPTDLPWAVEVDLADRPAGFTQFSTFHPTFLYESLWNLALAAVIVFVVERYVKLRPGRLFAIYVGGYGLGRLWVEDLRIDPANEPGGLRVNTWMSILLIVGSAAFLLVDRFRPAPAPQPAAADGDADATDEAGDAAEVAAESDDAKADEVDGDAAEGVTDGEDAAATEAATEADEIEADEIEAGDATEADGSESQGEAAIADAETAEGGDEDADDVGAADTEAGAATDTEDESAVETPRQ